jgi:phage-related protein
VEALPEIIITIVNFITDNLPAIIEMGIELIVQLAAGLIEAIPQLVAALPKIVAAIVEGIGKAVGKVFEIGANIVSGLWEGIQSLASWLWDKVSGWISSIWDGICDFFGIASPSKEMGWIGKMMVDGLAGSIETNGQDAVKAVNGMGEDIDKVMKGIAKDMETTLPPTSTLRQTQSSIHRSLTAPQTS